MISILRTHFLLLSVLIVFFLLGLFRLNDLSLYTDSTRYLIWGNSIAHARGWIDDTQPEPERYVVNAPFFPVLLAPALLIVPFSLYASKIWTLLWGVAALVLLYRWLERSLGRTGAQIGVLLLAFNPMMLVLSTEVLSEAPFLVVLIGAFLLLDRALTTFDDRRPFLELVALLSVVVLLREVAITLVIAVALLFLYRRRPSRAAFVIAAAAVVYAFWLYRNLVLVGTPATSQSTNLQFMFEHVVTAPDAPLYQELLSRMWLSLKGFGFQLAGMIFYSVPSTLIIAPGAAFRESVNLLGLLKPLVFLSAVPLMLGGIVLDVRHSPSASARIVLILLYLGIILMYPIHDVRFLLPLMPFMILYLLRAAQWLWRRGPTLLLQRAWLPVAATALLLIPNGLCIAEVLRTNFAYRSDPAAFHEWASRQSGSRTYFSQPFEVMGDWIRAHTPPDAVFASSAKEIVPFVGGRKVLEINDGVPLPTFEFMLRDNAVTYLLAVGMWDDVTSYDFHMTESRRLFFEKVSSLGNLHLYRIGSRLMLPRDQRRGWTFTFDTTSAAGLLRKGRWELIRERYDEARTSLGRALEIMPGQPVILYQQLLLNTFQRDSAGAVRTLEQMYASARATTYLWAGRTHVDAMNSLLRARETSAPEEQRMVRSYDIARLYWDLGYPIQAYRLMREIVQTDPEFFRGLLWAWHFGTQLGDVQHPPGWLAALEAIDRSNAVVRSFRTVTALQDTLRREQSATRRTALRLSIAAVYQTMELPEEALDEVERAIGEDPANAEAWRIYATMFLSKGKGFAAARATSHTGTSGNGIAF